MPVRRHTEVDLGMDTLFAGERNGDHLPAADFPRHRKRRQKRGSGVAQHQLFQHFQRTGDENGVKFNVRLGEKGIEGLPRGKTFVRQGKRQPGQLLQRDLRLTSKRMAGGKDHIVIDAGSRTHLHSGNLWSEEADDQVRFGSAQRLQGLACTGNMHLETELGVFETELRQHWRQKVRDRGAIGINGHPTALQTLQIVNQLVYVVEFAQRFAGTGGEQLTRRRQLHATAGTLHQGRAEIILEVLDLPAHRCRRDIQVFRRGAHGIGADEFVEIHQGAQLHEGYLVLADTVCHAGLDPASSAIKSLIAIESLTRGRWIPAQGRNDGRCHLTRL
ncbi:Hypothetical protein AT6N2_L1933 [Agrobacterium tumefaciens]|nr:Hypothetical protein AT6N2_L1933 [Agrobacterium tumefaciens]